MRMEDILDYMTAAGKPLYFNQIANYFPGELEEAELFLQIQRMVRRKILVRLETGKYEVRRRQIPKEKI